MNNKLYNCYRDKSLTNRLLNLALNLATSVHVESFSPVHNLKYLYSSPFASPNL